MDRITLTEAEILEELLATIDGPPEAPRGITAVEVAAERKISVAKARDLIRPLVAAGKLRPTTVRRGPQDGPHWMFEVPVKGYVRV